MKWATREAIHIDRAACAWLIRRAIDPDAEFVFVTDPADAPPTPPRSTCAASHSATTTATAASKPSCATMN
jgi:hypothetical protein